ncbi:MAG: hypothetical protein COB67_09830 [SAR324 cluster bacterium]|uniref:Uncharacterized protein n=1 Tax=SAR324 cluster bacterium TaxID=2024889 RepID=A0A2A4T0T8_9DELT|nr:MAG: hypothetical protein COB67_09830 [SAR324 cluster bacterium]
MLEATKQETQATLIFEKINRDKALFLRIACTLPQFDPESFEHYEVNRIVAIRDKEKTLRVSPLKQGSTAAACKQIGKSLRELQGNMTGALQDQYMRDENLFIIEKVCSSTGSRS